METAQGNGEAVDIQGDVTGSEGVVWGWVTAEGGHAVRRCGAGTAVGCAPWRESRARNEKAAPGEAGSG
ncbi:MAG: hypothetical protein ACI8U3_002819 [Brevundimonas sp.]|jgi:hypothetical protein